MVKIHDEFLNYNIKVFVHDPVVDSNELYKIFSIKNLELRNFPKLDILMIAVSHNQFKNLRFFDKKFVEKNGAIIDVKSVLKKKNNLKLFLWKI